MSIPLKVTVYEPGANGAPGTTIPRDISGWAETYSDSLTNEFGCETCRITGRVPSLEAAIDWSQRLMASVEVYTPTGRPRFFGFLHDVSIPALDIGVSLGDMANAVIVRYSDPEGKKGTQTATNGASIARYGRKEIVLSLNSVYAADALNRATMVLAQQAYPPNKEPVSLEGGGDAGVAIELTFRGWAETLKWLHTTSTTTATAVTSTQVTSLISTYNGTNNFFNTTSASVISTGFSSTQYCDPDTSYFDRIATLLALGNSSQQRVSWGFYSRAVTIGTSAGAAPDTIGYYYSKRTRTLRDAYGSEIPRWDWTPDIMIQNVDLIDPTAPTGALATLTRKYIKRVTCSIDKQGVVTGTLEPDDPDRLPQMLQRPSVTGTSSGVIAGDGQIIRIAPSRSIDTGNPGIYNPAIGVLLPPAGGTGAANVGTIVVGPGGIDLGGGSINTGGGSINTGGGDIGNTGGADIDQGTGSGIGGTGSSGVTTAGGTIGAIAKWATASTLTNAVSGTDYAPASHTHAAGDITSGTMATARLGSGSASSTTVLYGNSTWAAIAVTPSEFTGILSPDKGGTGINNATRTLTISTNSGALDYAAALKTLTIYKSVGLDGTDGKTLYIYKTVGLDGVDGKTLYINNTIGLSGTDGETLTLDASIRISGSGASSGEVLQHNGTAFVPVALTAADVSAGPSNATYIVQTASSGLSAEQALGALATGILKSTTTTGVVSIAVAGTDYAAASHTHTASDITNFGEAVDDEVAGLLLGSAQIALSYNDVANTLTISTTGVPGGSGTAGRVAEWSDSVTLQASTLIKSGAGVLTLSVASTQTITISGSSGGTLALGGNTLTLSSNLTTTGAGNITLSAGSAYTLTIPATGTATLGTGSAGRVAYWNGTNTVTSQTTFLYDDALENLEIGNGFSCAGLQTAAGVIFDFRGYTAGAPASTGYVTIEVAGVLRKFIVG